MTTKFLSKMFVILLAVSLITAACSPVAASVESTPTPAPPFTGEVTVQYEYGEDVPEQWLRSLPTTKLIPVSYDPEDGWGPITFEVLEYEGVTLFNLEVDPPNERADYDENGYWVYTSIGGCHWEWIGRSGGTLWYTFRNCSQVAADTVIPAVVTMEYCTDFEGGLLCEKEGLTVFITENYITFSAEDIFLPQYREWLREVLEYRGGGELPLVLQPNYSYTIADN